MNNAHGKLASIDAPELYADTKYNDAVSPENLHTLKLILICFFSLNIVLALTEWVVIYDQPYFGTVLSIRLFASALMITLLWSVHGLRSGASVEFWSNLFVMLTCVAASAINLQYGSPAILDMLLILVVYTIIPVSIGVAVVSSSIMTAVTIYLLIPLTDNPYNVDLLAGNFLGHVLGMAIGRSQRARRKELFWTATHERLLRQSLETAMHEVKRLSGLLPICCVCKKIRDKEGDWIRLEAYLQEHSDADFSHGYCPCCYKVAIAEVEQYSRR